MAAFGVWTADFTVKFQVQNSPHGGGSCPLSPGSKVRGFGLKTEAEELVRNTHKTSQDQLVRGNPTMAPPCGQHLHHPLQGGSEGPTSSLQDAKALPSSARLPPAELIREAESHPQPPASSLPPACAPLRCFKSRKVSSGAHTGGGLGTRGGAAGAFGGASDSCVIREAPCPFGSPPSL